MYRVKVYGAGSIGNHLTHAARTLGWSVTVCDTQDAALQRMKNEIYPARYGAWDHAIELSLNAQAPRGGFDLIFIGTPPEWHIPLALDALKESPKAILVEKPLGSPSLEGAEELSQAAQSSDTKVFVGYTHVVGRAAKRTEEILRSGMLGAIQTFDVEFREHWDGIFKAHPWLKGPEDTYLGYWERGGGASGEHSHAINLWQHFAHVLNVGRVSDVDATLRYVRQGKAFYDDVCLLQFTTETGMIGRVVQDVVTRPSRKRAFIQGTEGTLEWVANYNADGDAVIISKPGATPRLELIAKKRPDDFIEELRHVEDHLKSGALSSLDLTRGLDTMRVLAAAHKAQEQQEKIHINYQKPCTLDSLEIQTNVTTAR